MAELKAKKRNRLNNSTFALPSKRKYPIPDKSHARSALSYAARKDTEGSLSTVRAAVLKKFPDMAQTGGTKRKSRPKLKKWKKS